MDAVTYYVGQLMPLLWWALVLIGAAAWYRTRAVPVIPIASGSLVIALVITLSLLFPYEATLSEEGKLLAETQGLVSYNVQVLSTTTGLFLVVIGSSALLRKIGRNPASSS